jgi:REP element-mobilizing transposase RayT
MDIKFKNKYKINSIRLKNYDYSQSGSYFITICLKNRFDYFGQIINKMMILNKYGKIIEKYWMEIPRHFKNIILDEFIIMPNHLHGILIIKPTNHHRPQYERFGKPTKGSIPTIVRSFKSISTKIIHEFDKNFQWQIGFYERVIRNNLNGVRYYIKNNPKNLNKNYQ